MYLCKYVLRTFIDTCIMHRWLPLLIAIADCHDHNSSAKSFGGCYYLSIQIQITQCLSLLGPLGLARSICLELVLKYRTYRPNAQVDLLTYFTPVLVYRRLHDVADGWACISLKSVFEACYLQYRHTYSLAWLFHKGIGRVSDYTHANCMSANHRQLGLIAY